MCKNKLSPEEAFENFYRDVYGKRWEGLKRALLSKKEHVALLNGFCGEGHGLPISGGEVFCEKPLCKRGITEAPKLSSKGLYTHYFLDGASVYAAKLLNVEPGDRVLDLCAAPGGKSLVMAHFLKEDGELVCNDRSSARRGRLKRVLREYLPDSLLERIKVTGHDAGKWCLYEKEAYDKILLDAPCSSERHVLGDKKHLAMWSKKRTRRLAAEQWKILSSAIRVLKTGGSLIYSTCSLSPYENDLVIEKLLGKRTNVKVETLNLPFGESTTFGHIVLPDISHWGPLYLTKIIKTGVDD